MPGSLQRQASASLLVLHSQATCYLAACQREVPLTNTAPLLPFFQRLLHTNSEIVWQHVP